VKDWDSTMLKLPYAKVDVGVCFGIIIAVLVLVLLFMSRAE
jgi:hypothetical protein